MAERTTVSVAVEDARVFRQAVLDRFGTLRGFMGREASKALRLHAKSLREEIAEDE